MQPGCFDDEDRLVRLEKLGNSLPRLAHIVDWPAFRPLLQVIQEKKRKSSVGRKPHDVILMFNLLILQALNNLLDDQIEYHAWDRLSLQHFPGASVHDTQAFDDVLDENGGNTVWSESACRSAAREEKPQKQNNKSHTRRKGNGKRVLSKLAQAENHKRSKSQGARRAYPWWSASPTRQHSGPHASRATRCELQ